MTDLTERLRLIAAWRTRGGPTPKQACPSVYETTTEAATTLETLTQENARLEKDRGLAIKWANQSVSMLQDTFFPVAEALRDLEAYLAHTPHHNAPEAAAARKVLRAFDTCEVPPAPARKALGGGDER
ncbi:hypothetical protein [Sphingomonas sp. UMB7805-LC452B]|uniref:hypothetical protein n=1 Tax=Sphingomonas sp. UMB7805-LC452B TaxID=3046424 RepID=UPI00254CC2CE|nr:hypothetical protein [Sphingomonas sp. UMB7805-LC452B]MDK8216351.1 hypothetical protein [Sphingomonas sp. UMB7805-LC452B]